MTPKTPNVSFNMLYFSLMVPISGPRFIKEAHRNGRAVYAWTVNDKDQMKWLIKHEVDGIITDDVEKLVDARTAWEAGHRKIKVSISHYLFTIWFWILSSLFGFLLQRRLDRARGLKGKRSQ